MSSLETLIDHLLTSRLPCPVTAQVDPVGNLCQLRCPLCPVGAGVITDDRCLMPLDTFTTLLDKMPFLRTVELYRSGEPFLNPDLPAMIRSASNRGITVVTSSHFSFDTPDEFFTALVASGLDTLVVSLDGASPESYARYRVGGDFALVLANIGKLVAAREKVGSKTPRIIWQFLVNRYNEHEIATARSMAADLKVALELRPISLGDNEPDARQPCTDIEARKQAWLPEDQTYVDACYRGDYRYPLFSGVCQQLFTRVVIMADGSVLPCCEAREKGSAFGNLLEESFDAIWYGPAYRAARLLAMNGRPVPPVQSVCSRCHNFGTTPSVREKLRLLVRVYGKALRVRWQPAVPQL